MISPPKIVFSNVYYSQNSNVSAISNFPTDPTGLNGKSCISIYNIFSTKFSSLWAGQRLKIEPDNSPGTNYCCCAQGCPTQTPTTQFATTNIPTTRVSTTLTPTTNFLTTQFATTRLSTTETPTTNFPTTQQGSTLLSTTHNPIVASQAPLTTFYPTTMYPSTISITTYQASTVLSTTQTPTSHFPQTILPFYCYYQVPNCQNCPQNPPQVDLNQVNISCVFCGGTWNWNFYSKTGGTITNNGELVFGENSTIFIQGSLNNNASLNISSSSSVIVQGNFSQGSGGQTVFTFNPQQNNKSSPLNVGGCVSINGNVSLNLQTQPLQGTTNFQVISYNCSQQVNISSSQIQVIPNYNGSECDTINSQTINQPNSLGISLTSTIGNKCIGGKNLGLIIGLAVGIPCGIVLTLGISLAVRHYFRNKQFNQNIDSLGIEMKTGNQE